MNRPDLELPKNWKEDAHRAWEDYCSVEWKIKPENEYAYKVGWWHGAIWAKRKYETIEEESLQDMDQMSNLPVEDKLLPEDDWVNEFYV